MHAHRGPIAQDRGEDAVGLRWPVTAREAEVILVATQRPESLDAMHQQHARRLVGATALDARSHQLAQRADRVVHVAVAGHLRRHSKPRRRRGKQPSLGRVGGRTIQNRHLRRSTARCAHTGQRGQRHADGHAIVLTHDEQVGSGLPTQHGHGGLADGHRLTQMQRQRSRRTTRAHALAQRPARGDAGLAGAVEHDWRRAHGRSRGTALRQLSHTLLALVIPEPHHLERAVALDHAACVVVDRFTRPRQQARCGVVVAQDQRRIGLVALQRDANAHLTHGGSRQRVGAAQRLRAQDHVHAEGAALTHQSIEQQRRFLRHLVLFNEEFLELVHDQQGARHLLWATQPTPRGQILHASRTEQVAAPLQFGIQTLQHAQAEFTVALHRHRACVGQPCRGVHLELHALLEVDQPQFQFIWTEPRRHVHDHRVQQRALARARLARKQHMLFRAFAKQQALQLRGTRATDGHLHAGSGAGGPHRVRRGRDGAEGHLHHRRLLGGTAHVSQQFLQAIGGRRCIQRDGLVLQTDTIEMEGAVAPQDAPARAQNVDFGKPRWHRTRRVTQQQQMHAAAGTALQDAGEPARGVVAQARREVGHHDDAQRLGKLPGLGVVVCDGRVLVAQVLLDHRLHVLGEIRQLLLDVTRLGPDSLAGQLLHLVSQMHEAREALAQSHGIDEREAHLARGRLHQQSHRGSLQGGQSLLARLRWRIDQQRRVVGQWSKQRQCPRGRGRPGQCRIRRATMLQALGSQANGAHAQRRIEGVG